MKNFIRKLIKKLPLFFVFFIVVGYAFYEYRKSLKEEGKDGVSLLTEKLEDVEKIRLSNEASSLLIVKEKGDWFLKEPFEDFVDFIELSRWFEVLQSQRLKLVSEKPDIQWKDYYLESPPSVEISLLSGATTLFSVSKNPSFDGKWFVRKGKSLFLGSADLKKEVNEKTLNSYRSKKLLHSFGHPKRIQFNKREFKHSLDFSWEKSTWTYLKNKKLPLDSTHLNIFWTDLSSLKGDKIMGKATQANLKKWNLEKPFVKISLGFKKDEKDILIYFSSVKDDKVYSYTSERNYVLEISESQFEKILLSEENIRDHGQPFRYKKEEAFQIQLKSENISYTAQAGPHPSDTSKKDKKKKDSEESKDMEWHIKEPEGKKANSEELKALLNAIYNLEGKKYKQGSIGNIKKSLEIKSRSGELLFTMKAGDSYTKNKEMFFWLETNLSSDKVGISKSSLDFIFNKNPFKKEKTNETKDEAKPSPSPSPDPISKKP